MSHSPAAKQATGAQSSQSRASGGGETAFEALRTMLYLYYVIMLFLDDREYVVE